MLLNEYLKLARMTGHNPTRDFSRRWRWLTSAGNRLPIPVNYAIVGTMKGGTSALHYFLAQHPDICTPVTKETHFFASHPSWDRGSPDYDVYHDLFRHYRGESTIGEASPVYMYAPQVAPRLHAYNPHRKLIFMLRNPWKRAYSHYQMMVGMGHEKLSFSDALDAEPERLREGDGDYSRVSPRSRYSYVDKGLYMRQIENVLRYFPREQTLFLRSEDVARDHDGTMRQVYDFLGVDYVPIAPARKYEGKYQPIAPRDRARLQGVFAPEIDRLERFLGWDLAEWRG